MKRKGSSGMTFGTTVTVDGAVKGLEALGADLSSRGFMTMVMQGGGPPCRTCGQPGDDAAFGERVRGACGRRGTVVLVVMG